MRFVSTFITVLAQAMSFVILARVLLSWVPSLQQSRFGQLIYELSEPLLGPIRRVIPSLGMLDLSPFVALLIIELVAQLLHRLVG